jgi:hypothetical protein
MHMRSLELMIDELESTLETRLAYVLTGVPEIDDASAAGLAGLTQFLSERTALEPGAPVGNRHRA